MDAEYHYLLEFINEIQVVCPKCEQKAHVLSNPVDRSQTRLTCQSCGLSKEWKGQPGTYWAVSPTTNVSGIVLGQPVDCFFKLPLWLATDFRGHSLFAYNRKHLQFLKDFIRNKLRERRASEHGWSNRSLQSRLPKWMQSASNRSGLLKKIEQLENK